jgi:hypothetical protein
VEYVSRVPRPPLDGLIDDLYYLEGAPPYPRLTLPPMPSAVLGSATTSGRSRGLTPTRHLAVRRRFLREHPGHALDVGPLPAD